MGLGVVVCLKFGTIHSLGGFQDSSESQIRAEFLWRDLLWIGGS